jgi:hypothetical protein
MDAPAVRGITQRILKLAREWALCAFMTGAETHLAKDHVFADAGPFLHRFVEHSIQPVQSFRGAY